MSNPTDSGRPDEPTDPQSAPPPASAPQPAEQPPAYTADPAGPSADPAGPSADQPPAYPGSDAQPTQPYPDAQPYGQPTQPYLDAQPTQPYGQPSYAGAAAPGYPAPPPPAYPGQPGAGGPRDTRPRALAIIGLVAAALGFLLAFGAFIPVAGIAIGIVSLVLLLAGLVLSIVALASKKQGGKGLGIAGIIVSILGGVLAAIALVVSILATVFIGAASQAISDAEASPFPSYTYGVPSEEPSDDASFPPGESAAPLTSDEAAFVAAARPAFVGVIRQVEPDATDEIINTVYTDEALVGLGQLTLYTDRDAFVTSFTDAGSGFTADIAGQLYDALHGPAEQYLQ